MKVTIRFLVLRIVLCGGSFVHLANAQSQVGIETSEQKCILYQNAWGDAVNIIGATHLSREFISRNDQFIATGCTGQGNVCPKSDQEFEIANMLTMMTMNEGMASTFVPFSCRNDTESDLE